MRDSVLLTSWDTFLVTLPSITSQTCVMYSSVIPRARGFCDWLFLGSTCVLPALAANFILFGHFREKVHQCWRLKKCVSFKTNFEFNENVISPFEVKGFQPMTVKWVRQNFQIKLVQWYTKNLVKIVLPSLHCTFYLVGNVIVNTPSQFTNEKKYFNHISFKDKRCELRWWKNTFPPISSFKGFVFSIFWRKNYQPNRSEREIEVLTPALPRWQKN